MTHQAARHQKLTTARNLRKTLQALEEIPPKTSYKEADQFVCSVCNMPVKPCEADARATCFHMMREGTELQSLYSREKDKRQICVSCGKIIPQKTLRKNPTTELCSTCLKKTIKIRKQTVSKGALS